MKIIIIGDGVAGQTAAETIIKHEKKKMDDKTNDNDNIEITIISNEGIPYYSRINLPQYIVGSMSIEQLIIRKLEWYKEKRINLFLNSQVIKINRDEKYVIAVNLDLGGSEKNIDERGNVKNIKNTLENAPENTPVEKRYDYDKLIIATGSNARKFDFGNPALKCLFTLRNVKDADEINNFILKRNVKDIFIIGGGLLGIELAYHLVEANYNVIICEVAQYLLPRQLDEGTAGLLKAYLNSKNIEVICGSSIKCIEEKSDPDLIEITLKDEKNTIIKTDMILEQVGISLETKLAKESGLDVDKGIKVNKYMQTNDGDIYAAGDCIQFEDNIWGIIPASREQAIKAADHIMGINPSPYQPTTWSTNLKIAGIKVKSYGIVPDDNDSNQKIFSFVDKENSICRKAVVNGDKLVGAVFLGEGNDSFFRKNIFCKINEEDIEMHLKENSK